MIKTFVFIILLIHAFIHILGFIKAFFKDKLKELKLQISKTFGIIWLISSILLFIYAIIFISDHQHSWVIGFIAIIVSQILIFRFWKDSKYGSFINLLILLLIFYSYSTYEFNKLTNYETSIILSKIPSTVIKNTYSENIKNLPAPVQKWIVKTGVVGKPQIYVGIIKQKALIKLKPDQKNWYKATAIQYTTIDTPAFIWTVNMKMLPGVYFNGRDKFQNGKGEMLIKVNNIFNVVKETGEKLDEGAAIRYLAELIWFPSLALNSFISWKEIDSLTAEATFTYKGKMVSGMFYFNENGDFVKFESLRYKDNTPNSKRYPWIVRAYDYAIFDEIRVPSKLQVIWKLDKNYWTWLNIEITDIKYNSLSD